MLSLNTVRLFNLFLKAPPGAGKTSVVPIAMLMHNPSYLRNHGKGASSGGKKIILLVPRRVVAKAAARRMASMLGEKVGQTVGFRVRNERAIGPTTRIEVPEWIGCQASVSCDS